MLHVKVCARAAKNTKVKWTSQDWNGTVNVGSYVTTHTSFYGTIHYLTREVRVKLHAKTNTARITKRWVRYRFSLNRIIFRIISWKKKERKKTAVVLFGFILSASCRKPFQSQLSKLPFCQQMRNKVSRIWSRSRSDVSDAESSKTPIADECFTIVQNFIRNTMTTGISQ